MNILELLSQLVKGKFGESARRSAVDGVLRAFGWSTVAESATRKVDGVNCRIFTWKDTGIGSIILCLPKEGDPWVGSHLEIREKAPGEYARVQATAPPRPSLKRLGQQQANDPVYLARHQAGMDKARRLGKHLGRPLSVQIDLDKAVALMKGGHGYKSAARELNVVPDTLRRHLIKAGLWPVPYEGK